MKLSERLGRCGRPVNIQSLLQSVISGMLVCLRAARQRSRRARQLAIEQLATASNRQDAVA